ncbi:DUF1772-domain-containing protein [Coniochaeta ligniaria NRRL 30616]|uniref:DUF1772-domain-containing protein n=1 Tax=Coniochaeta ligniaria NRRL 30616 TaxID=1408157 RepID=A0A1J7IDT9_9PEZI|nr:DUF1772-domain-containing protein [Coniochaeta ligniaria NRRL 30616]
MSTTAAHRVALVTGSLLSGAMLSLSLIAVPVLLDTTTQAPQLLHQWVRMYHYGHQVLPTMAVGTSLLYAYTAVGAQKKQQPRKNMSQWRILTLAALATVGMVPFTWLVMVPTNNQLFRLQLASKTDVNILTFEAARALVVSWSWMHLTRSLMPLVGAVLGAAATF